MNGVIYMYTAPNGKQYIGQTINESNRKKGHKYSKRKGPFQNAIKKYGYDAMSYSILHSGIPSHELLNVLERIEIISRQTLHPNGYNYMLGQDYHYQSKENNPIQCYETGQIFHTKEAAGRGLGIKNAASRITKDVVDNPSRTVAGFHWCTPFNEIDKTQLRKKHHRRPVKCVETGQIFDSATEALDSMGWGGKNSGLILEILNISHKTCNGLHWSDPNFVHTKPLTNYESEPSHKHKITECIETSIKYPSLKTAAAHMGVSHGAIGNAIKRGSRCRGYHWRYV